MNIAIITDNKFLYEYFKNLISNEKYDSHHFVFFSSQKNNVGKSVKKISVKNEYPYLIKNFSLVISLHCKQLFPSELVARTRCVNIHPGFNPYNRGWFPQVFSIINDMPIGATIHEIDDALDHGPIIAQAKVEKKESDTSLTLYNRVLEKEQELLNQYLLDIIDNSYNTYLPENEGNVNLKLNFNDLCEIKMDHIGTFKEHIDYLRALSHDNFKNAFFIDQNGQKVFLKLDLEKE